MIVAVNTMREAGIVHGDLHLDNVLLIEREFYFDLEHGTVADAPDDKCVKMNRMIRIIDWDKSKMFDSRRDDPRDEGYDAVALLKILTWWFECGLTPKLMGEEGELWARVVDSFHRSTIDLRRHQPIKWLFALNFKDFKVYCDSFQPPLGLQYTEVPEGKTWGPEQTHLIWNAVRMLYFLLSRQVLNLKDIVKIGPFGRPFARLSVLLDALYLPIDGRARTRASHDR
jgi:hypothetical protein